MTAVHLTACAALKSRVVKARHLSPVVNSDIAFFEHHPDRRYRARRANDVEVAQAEELLGELLQAPQGECWFTLVKKVPGANLRMLVQTDDDG